MTYRSDGLESLIAQGMTEYLGELLKASEDASRAPKTRANEPNPPSPPPADPGPERTQSRPA
jgi:hypothetical protein